MNDIIKFIDSYIIYIYPGFIFLAINSFLLAKEFELKRDNIIHIIVDSYIFVFVYTKVKGVYASDLENIDYIIIAIISAVIPFFTNCLRSCFGDYIEKIFLKININTGVDEMIFDRIYRRRKRKKNQDIYVRIYSLKHPFRYEGKIESYEYDGSNKMRICLSQCRIMKIRCVGKRQEYELYKDFTNDVNRYLYVNLCDFECIEIQYVEKEG